MALDPDEVIAEVRKMRLDVKSRQFNTAQLREKYEFLHKNVEHLFDIIVADKINYLPMLRVFLDHLRTVKDKESMEENDKKIGEILAEKYLYPNIDTKKEGIDFNQD